MELNTFDLQQLLLNVSWAGVGALFVIYVIKPIVTHFIARDSKAAPYYDLKKRCDSLENNHIEHVKQDVARLERVTEKQDKCINDLKRSIYSQIHKINTDLALIKQKIEGG